MQSANIHANSKYYYPKDAEFLSNDFMSKPGAKFNVNRNAVLIKDDKPSTVDPNLEEVTACLTSSGEICKDWTKAANSKDLLMDRWVTVSRKGKEACHCYKTQCLTLILQATYLWVTILTRALTIQ